MQSTSNQTDNHRVLRLCIFMVISILLTGCSGTSEVKQKQYDIFPFPCKTKARAYYVDRDGNEMEDLNKAIENLNLGRWWEPGFFYDGVLRIDYKETERVCLFLDEKGNEVLNLMQDVFPKIFPDRPELARCSDFSNGIAFVRRTQFDSNVFAINKNGEVLYEFEGIPTSGFNKQGQAFFEVNGKYGVMTTKGEILFAPSDRIRILYPEEPPVKNCFIVQENNGGLGLMRLDGSFVISPDCYRLSNLDENNCVVFKRSGENDQPNTIGIADNSGKVLWQANEKDYREFENDGKWYYFMTSDNEVGWCDKNGVVKIGPLKKYDDVSFRSQVEWYPRPFYGAAESVGTNRSIIDGDYFYTSGCMSVKALKEMSTDGDYNLNVDVKASYPGVLLITPIVNGRAVGIDMTWEKAFVYSFNGGKLRPIIKAKEVTEMIDEGFIPKYDYYYFHNYGKRTLNPVFGWSGV